VEEAIPRYESAIKLKALPAEPSSSTVLPRRSEEWDRSVAHYERAIHWNSQKCESRMQPGERIGQGA